MIDLERLKYPRLSDGEIDGKLYVSQSEISTFRDCPLKWYLANDQRLQSPTKDVRLDIGTIFHRLLEVFYSAWLDPDNGPYEVRDALLTATEYAGGEFAQLSEQFPSLDDEVWLRLRWMLDGYIGKYAMIDWERWTPIQLEKRFEFPMPVPGADNLHFTGKIDALMLDRKTDKVWIWDNKTASKRDVSKDGWVFEALLEDQFPLYVAARRKLGLPVEGLIVNAIRTDMPKKRELLDSERFNRIPKVYPQPALDAIWADFEATARAMIESRDDPGRIYSVPNPQQCRWKCQFMQVHLESRHSGRNPVEVALRYGFVQGDDSALPPELAEEGW